MMSSFLAELMLYRKLIMMQIRSQLQYRANLAFDILTSLISTVLEFVALLLFFIPFPSLFGWHMGEVALLSSLVSISFGLADMVGAGIDNFAYVIKRGEFDRVLLRPVGTFWQIIGSDFRLKRAGRITQGILGLLFALHFLPTLHWTPDKFLLLPLAVLCGATMFVAILLVGATICFWTIETTELVNIFTYGAREMLSYPLTVFHQGFQRLFLFVIPVGFCSYVPTCYLLGRPLPFGLPAGIAFAAPIFALIVALVSGALWRFGVFHYQSTGS